MAYVVVLLMASECDADPGTRCVMDVIGPFPCFEDAHAELAEWPEWTTPHVMQLHNPAGYPDMQAQLVVRLDLP